MEAPARWETPFIHHCVDSPAIFWGTLENIQMHTLVGYQLTVRMLHFWIGLSYWVGPLWGLLTTSQSQSRSHGNHLSFRPHVPLELSNWNCLDFQLLISNPQNGSKIIQVPKGQSTYKSFRLWGSQKLFYCKKFLQCLWQMIWGPIHKAFTYLHSNPLSVSLVSLYRSSFQIKNPPKTVFLTIQSYIIIKNLLFWLQPSSMPSFPFFLISQDKNNM
jgi:hypothetical protein